jgi:hypothetical protein
MNEFPDTHPRLSEQEEQGGIRTLRLSQDFLEELVVFGGKRSGQIFWNLGEVLPVERFEKIFFHGPPFFLPSKILSDREEVIDFGIGDEIPFVQIREIILQEGFGQSGDGTFSQPVLEVGEIDLVAPDR